VAGGAWDQPAGIVADIAILRHVRDAWGHIKYQPQEDWPVWVHELKAEIEAAEGEILRAELERDWERSE
jgi:hypothetical protein